jgi:hypothetical protein
MNAQSPPNGFVLIWFNADTLRPLCHLSNAPLTDVLAVLEEFAIRNAKVWAPPPALTIS